MACRPEGSSISRIVTFSVPSRFSVTVHAVSVVEAAGAGLGLDPDAAFCAVFPPVAGCPAEAVTATATAAPAASAEAAAQVSLRRVRLTGRAWRRAGAAGGSCGAVRTMSSASSPRARRLTMADGLLVGDRCEAG